MERLYTPWRATWVSSADQSTGCFLCSRPAERNDAENFILYRSATAFVVLNLFPYNTGHLLVAPFQHTADFAHLPRAVTADIFALVQRCTGILEDTYHPAGFNIGMNLGAVAGAGLPDHLHAHIVPRWGGDNNFMATLGDTRVLPESIGQSYPKLQPNFQP